MYTSRYMYSFLSYSHNSRSYPFVRTSHAIMRTWNTHTEQHLPWSTCISNTIMYSVFCVSANVYALGLFYWIGLHCTRLCVHIKSTCCAHFLHLSSNRPPFAPSTHTLCLNSQWFFLVLLFSFVLFGVFFQSFALFWNMKYILSINRDVFYSMLIFPIPLSTHSFRRSIWTICSFLQYT